jgi:3-oxoacyl-[acyl-carrier-protein] synthase-3
VAVTIVGSGHYVPGEPVTNSQLARVMDTADDWIKKRTGIAQRHFAAAGEGVSDLAVHAARRAIEDAKIEASEIDMIVFCTMTPEHVFPGPGGLLGSKLGIPGVPAYDLRQQCAAMPYSFVLANGLIASKAATTVLVVGAETHAGFMPWRDWDVLRGTSDRAIDPETWAHATKHRGCAVLFGDGAAAFVLRDAPAGRGLLEAEIHSDGRMAHHIYIPLGFARHPYVDADAIAEDQHLPHMAGPELFKSAVTELAAVTRSVVAKAGFTLDDVDWFIAHQANDRINEAVRKSLGVPHEKVPSNIARYGNTSAATIGLLTDELRRAGRVREGQLVCMLALGSGLHWGAMLIRM